VDKAREGGTFVSNHQFVDDDGNALVLTVPSTAE